MCCIVGDIIPFFPTVNKMLWIPLQLLKTRFDWGSLLKILSVDMKKNQDSSTLEIALRLDDHNKY